MFWFKDKKFELDKDVLEHIVLEALENPNKDFKDIFFGVLQDSGFVENPNFWNENGFANEKDFWSWKEGVK